MPTHDRVDSLLGTGRRGLRVLGDLHGRCEGPAPVNPDVKHLLDQVGREARNATLLLFLLGRLQRRRLGPVVGAGIPRGFSFEVAADLAVNDCPPVGRSTCNSSSASHLPIVPDPLATVPRRGSRYGDRVG